MLLIQFCCFLLLISSLFVYVSSNPVNSVLFLILSFFSSSFIFILLNGDFLGFLILIIYVGAIAVLFLFIVMMVNIKKLDYDGPSYFFIGFFLFVIFFLQLYYYWLVFSVGYFEKLMSLNTFYFDPNVLDDSNKFFLLSILGYFLFFKYPVLLGLSGLMLILTVVFSIHLTNFKKGFSIRKQYNQLSRNSNLYVLYCY